MSRRACWQFVHQVRTIFDDANLGDRAKEVAPAVLMPGFYSGGYYANLSPKEVVRELLQVPALEGWSEGGIERAIRTLARRGHLTTTQMKRLGVMQ